MLLRVVVLSIVPDSPEWLTDARDVLVYRRAMLFKTKEEVPCLASLAAALLSEPLAACVDSVSCLTPERSYSRSIATHSLNSPPRPLFG